MNKAKSLKFPLQSEPDSHFFYRQFKEIVESAEILFWHSFIHLATTLQKRQQKAHGWQRQTPTVPILTGWQGYALFSALSLFGGVLIGFLFGHLF